MWSKARAARSAPDLSFLGGVPSGPFDFARTQRSRPRRTQRAPVAGVAWTPYPDRDGQPSPQRMAAESQADVLGYGGAAGGGKSDLLLGLAGTAHWRSVIFRRTFPKVRALVERSREIYNATDETHAKDSYNEQLHIWRLHDGRQVEFSSMQYEENKKDHQGRPRDLYGFDEATEFSESQVRFVIGWNRSTHIDPATGRPQRCRVVLTFNPPLDEAGDWIITFFLPWMAYLYPDQYQYPNPARPGELRYFATLGDTEREVAEADLQWYAVAGGKHWQVADGEPFLHGGRWVVPQRGLIHDGKLVQAKSRTFIPAALADNPILEASGYGATIDALPEPLRTLLKGQFGAARVANPWQVIPSEWVRLAQQRWRERGRPDLALSAVGVDVAHGGADSTVITRLYGPYGTQERHAGKDTPRGSSVVMLLADDIAQEAPIGIDVIGVGASAYDALYELDGVDVVGVNFGASAPDGARDVSGKLAFRNLRAYCYWQLREDLDPERGADLMLPDDDGLRADLCAPTWSLSGGGILVEEKKDIVKRLGRSPDAGDSYAIAYYVQKHHGGSWLLFGGS